MADKRSVYEFSNEQDFNDAKDAIYNHVYSCYSNSDKLYFNGWYGGNYRMTIYSDITQDELEQVVSIIREHQGHYIND